MPASGRVGALVEVHDSKEFTRNSNLGCREGRPKNLQNLTENGESPTFFRSIASKKVMLSGRNGGAKAHGCDSASRGAKLDGQPIEAEEQGIL